MSTSRRSFFTQALSMLALLAAPRVVKAKPLAMKPEDITTGFIDPAVKWGPGKTHPGWRVPQGRWTFVEDK